MIVENICEIDIITKISWSDMDKSQKDDFIKLISYFTPKEIEELRLIL